MTLYETTCLLIACHFLCDYPLQSEFIAVGKGSFDKPHNGVPWYYCMFAHCAVHGMAVGLVTGYWTLGAIETVLHFGIDYAKCRKITTIHDDQIFHLACKLGFVLAMYVENPL